MHVFEISWNVTLSIGLEPMFTCISGKKFTSRLLLLNVSKMVTRYLSTLLLQTLFQEPMGSLDHWLNIGVWGIHCVVYLDDGLDVEPNESLSSTNSNIIKSDLASTQVFL